jgi:glycosyltransferase involved in cell wall biosynthesis
MITKNEEDNLSRCLKTVLPIADEILITDTGSTDSTIEIARKFTNNIFSIKWEEDDGLGNFARARNESIKNAKGDYIFWIDADEQLEQSHQMFQFIQSGYYDSVVCKQKHCLPRDRYETDINPDPYPDRLFKNDGTLCFEGVIHEFVAKKGTWVKKALFQDAYWILHYGNTSLDLLKSKSLSRNPPLIAKNARLYPDSIMAKFYIMVDAWSKFVESRSPDLFYLAYGIWNEHFVGTKDKFAQFGAFDIIQKFYHYMATHNISLDDERIQMFSFTNDSATLEFYARESESKLFLQIKTT